MVSSLKNLCQVNITSCIFLLFIFTDFSISSNNIQTKPELSNNIYAYGFDNLTLIAKFVKPSSGFGFCIWNINDMTQDELGVLSLTLFGPVNECNQSSICEEVEEDGVTYIVSELTINIKIEFDVDTFVECDDSTVASWNGLAKNCLEDSESGLEVNSTSPHYNCSGEFTCSSNETLVKLDGNCPSTSETVCQFNAKWSNPENLTCSIVCPTSTPNNVSVVGIISDLAIRNSSGYFSCEEAYTLFDTITPQPRAKNKTTCLDNGQWENQEMVGCWKAPIVELLGNVTLFEGGNLSLTCNYADVTPNGNMSAFFVETECHFIPKNDPFVKTNVSRLDNGKSVNCKAITPYTEVCKQTGLSNNTTLNVQYKPIIMNTTGCTWELNMTGRCNITIESNPVVSTLESLKKGDIDVDYFQILNITSSTETNFSFIQNEVRYEDDGIYTMKVTTSEDFANISLEFEISVVNDLTSTTIPTNISSTPSPLTLTIALSSVGAVLGIILIVGLLFFFWKRSDGFCNRKNRSKTDELSHRENFQEPQLSANELYQPVSKRDSLNKKSKGNELYVPLESQGSNFPNVEKIEPAYSQVEVKKEKENKSYPAIPDTKDVYAQVNKNKSETTTKRSSDSEVKLKGLYAQVDTKTKKNPTTTQTET